MCVVAPFMRKGAYFGFCPVSPFRDISSNLSRALSCLCLTGHNCLVQRMRHNRNRRPYELRICDICDWHSVQDEEHILLDCPHEHHVSLRTQHRQLVFPPQYEDSLTRLRNIFKPARYIWRWVFAALKAWWPVVRLYREFESAW